MNISEFSQWIGRSRATVYRRAEAANIDLDALRGADGELTEEGLAILGSLFDRDSSSPGANAGRRDSCDSDADGAGSDAVRQCEMLQRERDEARREVQYLREQLQREREQADCWRAVAMHSLPAATAPEGAAPTIGHEKPRGFFAKLRFLFAGSHSPAGSPSTDEHSEE